MKKILLFISITLIIAGCGTSELNTTNTCKSCHTNANMLQSADPSINPTDFLVTQGFFDSPHGILQCVDCHKGNPSSASMQQAHSGMINDPSLNPNTVCTNCHAGIVQSYTTSLHYTLAGEQSYLDKVSCPYNDNLNVPYTVDCQRCHASCGNCHVEKPLTGGLISGHTFMPIPPMQQTCLQCHKDQANEFLGLSGQAPDVHYTNGMQCIDCHGNGIHGDGITYTTMWDVKEMPQCGMCHTDVTNGTSNIAEHNVPQMKVLNCTVCHAQPYTNTYNYTSMFVGDQYVGSVSMTVTDFEIGFNTIPAVPYLYTTVRHYPITRDTFDYFGINLLNGFNLVPTWQTTSPHNIQAATPQNASCNDCHINAGYFLTRDMLDPNDSLANLGVVTQPPPAVK
jgi:thiosulfate/3-mercaptopyruvate sulfurtransferase